MATQPPLISIGLPVYNGEAFLADAINSVLMQTFTDFELIISDNASTDRTQEICLSFAAQDPRIRYDRSSKNLGAARNFNRTFELASGTYFKWMAHDDLLAPEFLARCVDVLEHSDRSVILCFSTLSIIDSNGAIEKENYSNRLTRIAAPQAPKRFKELILERHGCFHIWGLIRADVLARTPLIGSYVGSDRGLLAELGLHGRFHEIPEDLFMERNHPGRSCKAIPFYLRTGWFDTSKQGARTLPNWRILAEYLKAIRRAPLRQSERMQCYLLMPVWIVSNGNWARLLMDLMVALQPNSWRLHIELKNWLRGRRSGHQSAPG